MLSKNGIQHSNTLLIYCQKMFSVVSLQTKHKRTMHAFLGNILTIDGYFNCATSHVKVLGWLEKEKEDKILTVSGRPP